MLIPFFFMCIFKKDMERWRFFFFKVVHRTSWYLLEAKSVHWKLQCPVCFVHDAGSLLDILGQSAWKHIHNPRQVFGRRTQTIAASQALLDGHGILKAMDKFNLSKPKAESRTHLGRMHQQKYIIKPSTVELYMLGPALFVNLKVPKLIAICFWFGSLSRVRYIHMYTIFVQRIGANTHTHGYIFIYYTYTVIIVWKLHGRTGSLSGYICTHDL